MKLRNIFPALALSAVLLTSCDEQIMEWYKDPTHGEIASKDLPLPLAEKITRYKELNTYTNFVLGVGIDLTMYLENETYRNIINANFDQVTIGYHMKHGAMVNSKGEINFTNVDALLSKLAEANITVYGHTLVWHQNQNASYLNGLIASTVIPGSSGTNLLTNGDFEGGTTGWGSWGGGKSAVELSTTTKLDGANSLKIVTNSTSNQAWSVQVQAPAVTLIAGHRYEISMFVKSEGTGAVRLSFGDATQMSVQYPAFKSDNGAETTATNSTWKQLTYRTSTISLPTGVTDFAALGTSMQFRLDCGKIPNMTYYLDHVTVVDLDAGPTNMLSNGTMDTDLTGWGVWNGGASILTQATAAQAFQGNGAMKVVNATSNSGGQWKVQIHSDFTSKLPAGTYVVSYYVKSEAVGSIRCSTTGNAMYQGDQATGPTWKQVQWEITTTGAEAGLNFDLGLVAGTYYIDNVTVYDKSKIVVTTPPVTIDKTPAEKATLIGNALNFWITNMMTHYKGQVKAWDVVNEPMKDDGTLRDGNVAAPASDEFYWVKYLGRNYAATAFKLARANGNVDDKFFINDYNLEYNLVKCDSLIEYVKYTENQGAKIDGIGTQMHININSDTLKIDQMFQKLAATGKLIKVSELDIQVKTSTPTVQNYAAQAKMYQYVINSYMKYIPEAQRYGITIWGVSDAVKEHINWLPNDAPCLWDKDYKRKHAYKGVADGLAGKDVSLEFSGDIQY